MSYRLFHYGPTGLQAVYRKLGLTDLSFFHALQLPVWRHLKQNFHLTAICRFAATISRLNDRSAEQDGLAFERWS